MKKSKKLGVDKTSVMARDFDWVLFGITVFLSIFGIIVIYSATRTLNSITNVIVQSAAMGLGIGVMITICMFDYEQFKNLIKPIYIFSVLILILVLVFGVTGDWGLLVFNRQSWRKSALSLLFRIIWTRFGTKSTSR